MKFKAAILEKTGQPLLVDDVECLPLQAHDVLVRLQASGLCHTDYEVIQGSLPYPLPIILGHEGAGIVEEIGPSVKSVKVGDKVICSWNPFCGHCFYCVRNQPILCEASYGWHIPLPLAWRKNAPLFSGFFSRTIHCRS